MSLYITKPVLSITRPFSLHCVTSTELLFLVHQQLAVSQLHSHPETELFFFLYAPSVRG